MGHPEPLRDPNESTLDAHPLPRRASARRTPFRTPAGGGTGNASCLRQSARRASVPSSPANDIRESAAARPHAFPLCSVKSWRERSPPRRTLRTRPADVQRLGSGPATDSSASASAGSSVSAASAAASGGAAGGLGASSLGAATVCDASVPVRDSTGREHPVGSQPNRPSAITSPNRISVIRFSRRNDLISVLCVSRSASIFKPFS